jgi:hypothetical protein
VPKGSTKTFLNITLANGCIGYGYSNSWTPRLNPRLPVMALPHDMHMMKFRCISPYQLVDTGISNRIQTENQYYQITYSVTTAPQNLADIQSFVCHIPTLQKMSIVIFLMSEVCYTQPNHEVIPC